MNANLMVLVVDDEPGVLRLAREVLMRAGFEVLTARRADAAEAICREHEGPIDLVVMDVILPDDSGLELFPTLRGLRPNLQVVFMGGYPSELVIGCKVQGAVFVQKPFQPAELSEAVQSVLAGRTQNASHHSGPF